MVADLKRHGEGGRVACKDEGEDELVARFRTAVAIVQMRFKGA